MADISVQLNLNQPIFLVPITLEEKKKLEKKQDDALYVLYQTPLNDKIEVGMLASYIQNCSPGLANLDRLPYATNKAYFYSGGSQLLEQMDAMNRPIYSIVPTIARTVHHSQIVNVCDQFLIPLSDLIKNYDSYSEKKVFQKK